MRHRAAVGPLRRWCRLVLLLAATIPPAGLAAAPALAEPRPLSEASRRFLCPHGGAPVPGQRGRCRPARGGTPGGGVAGGSAGWDAGLPPPSHQVAPCPAGTIPVAPLAGGPGQRCLPR